MLKSAIDSCSRQQLGLGVLFKFVRTLMWPQNCQNVNIQIDPFATLVPKCQYSDRSIRNIGTQITKCQYSDRSICNIGTQITQNQFYIYIYIYIYICIWPCLFCVIATSARRHLRHPGMVAWVARVADFCLSEDVGKLFFRTCPWKFESYGTNPSLEKHDVQVLLDGEYYWKDPSKPV